MTQVLSTPAACAPMDVPFGYGFFDNGRDEPAPPAEPPAPGKPLLSDSDTSLNNRIFNDLADPHLMQTLSQQYPQEPVPNLYGSSSHFGHPDLDLSRTLGLFQQNGHFNPGPLSAPAHTSVFPDQHQGFFHPMHAQHPPQHQHQHQQQQRQPQQQTQPQHHQQLQQLQQPTPHQHQHQQHQQQQQQQQQQQPMAMPPIHRTHSVSFVKPEQAIQAKPTPMNMRANFSRRASTDVAPIVLGGETYNHTAREMLKDGRDARPDSYLERRMTFTYGSDTGFKDNAYTPPETLRNHQKLLEAQKMNIVHTGYKAPMRRGSRPQSAGGMEEPPMSARSNALESIADEDEALLMEHAGRKRGRGDLDDDEVAENGNVTPSQNRKKAKPSVMTNVSGTGQDLLRSPSGNVKAAAAVAAAAAAAGTNGSARKASDAASAAKPTRVNLTEEEKKMNHIRSEQKRRNQIKEGFADLTELMPDAASTGPSKCNILAKAVEWLGDLIEGNKELKKQLAGIKGSAGIDNKK